MNFKNLNEVEKKAYAEIMFKRLSSPDELKDWIKAFLDLEYPNTITDKESTSNPVDAIWQVYDAFAKNDGAVPGAIWLSARECLKTVSVAILEIILMLHFELEIAHAAAVESQSGVCLKYIQGFFFKIEPLINAHGWEKASDNKRTFEFQSPSGRKPFIKVVICTPKGMNSLHANLLVVDELDLADRSALNEGKNIVGVSRGVQPFTLFLSTRKYSFGLMAEMIEKADEMHYKLLRWNILDVTEVCGPERHLPEGPKTTMYVAKSLPLKQIGQDEYDFLTPPEQVKYEMLEAVHEGCVKCSLLPICRMRLSQLPKSAKNGFYKPIKNVQQKFRENSPEIAEAQLLCFGPETQILMGDGTQKSISEVVVGDEVITHNGNIQQVTETFKRPYSGEVFKVENHSWKHFDPTIVTPEHPYFVNGRNFKSVKELRTFVFDKWGSLKSLGDYTSLPSHYLESKLSYIRYTEFVHERVTINEGTVRLDGSVGRFVPIDFPIDYDFGWILGYFLAEGFLAKDRRSKISEISGIVFCSDVRETEYHDRVRAFAASLGLTTSEFKANASNGYTIDIYNPTLAHLFLALCGQLSDKKQIHAKLINANLEFLKGVLNGFDAGDGTKRKNSYRELTTCSISLASQLSLIAARLGLCPRVTRKPKPVNGKQPYLVHHIDPDYSSSQKRTRYKFENGYNQYRMDNLIRCHYDGFVYNFEVEGDHSYIANNIAVHNCWKPGSQGLVYPRFSASLDSESSNHISVGRALQTLLGIKINYPTEHNLLQELIKLGVPMYAGVDWGFTHDSVILIVAMIPNGEVWIIDCWTAPGMEFTDILDVAMRFRDKYPIQKWFCDPAMPSHLKSFNKNGMKSPDFNKDVIGGIEALRSKIVNAAGRRFLKIIKTENTKKVLEAITKHKFKLDGQGNPSSQPDDEMGIADICDSARYIAQNLFPIKGPFRLKSVQTTGQQAQSQFYSVVGPNDQMQDELYRRVSGGTDMIQGSTRKKGGFHWNF